MDRRRLAILKKADRSNICAIGQGLVKDPEKTPITTRGRDFRRPNAKPDSVGRPVLGGCIARVVSD